MKTAQNTSRGLFMLAMIAFVVLVIGMLWRWVASGAADGPVMAGYNLVAYVFSSPALLLVIVAVLGIVAILLYVSGNEMFATWQDPEQATVIERVYESERSSSGVAPVIGSNLQMGVAFTSSSTDEQWTVIVQTSFGVMDISVTPDEWAKCEKGTSVSVQWKRGGFSGKLSECRLVS